MNKAGSVSEPQALTALTLRSSYHLWMLIILHSIAQHRKFAAVVADTNYPVLCQEYSLRIWPNYQLHSPHFHRDKFIPVPLESCELLHRFTRQYTSAFGHELHSLHPSRNRIDAVSQTQTTQSENHTAILRRRLSFQVSAGSIFLILSRFDRNLRSQLESRMRPENFRLPYPFDALAYNLP